MALELIVHISNLEKIPHIFKREKPIWHKEIPTIVLTHLLLKKLIIAVTVIKGRGSLLG